jgi:LemA protein
MAMTATLIVVGILVLLVIWLVSLYNRLVTLRNRFKNAFSQIDVQLKRRYDLIPNLVETAKGYLRHERETLEAVISARNRAMGAEQQAAAKPGDPEAMGQLMEELASTENRIAFARQAYNDSVTEYNTGREKMPAALIAGPMGFTEARLLEIEAPQEREAVKVSFS